MGSTTRYVVHKLGSGAVPDPDSILLSGMLDQGEPNVRDAVRGIDAMPADDVYRITVTVDRLGDVEDLTEPDEPRW